MTLRDDIIEDIIARQRSGENRPTLLRITPVKYRDLKNTTSPRDWSGVLDEQFMGFKVVEAHETELPTCQWELSA